MALDFYELTSFSPPSQAHSQFLGILKCFLRCPNHRYVIMSRIFFLLSYPDAFNFLFLTNFPRQSLLYIQCGIEIVTVLDGDLRRKVSTFPHLMWL